MTGAVLLIGLLATVIRPGSMRVFATAVQVFALPGTGVGIYTIVAGFGPQSALDAVFHACMALALIAGLAITIRPPHAPMLSGGPAPDH